MRLTDVLNNVLRTGEFEVLGIIDSATELPMLTFIENEKYLHSLLSKKHIKCVITTEELGEKLLNKTQLGVAISDSPRNDFFKLHNHLGKGEGYSRRRFKTNLGENCKISPLACIAEYNVEIGDNVVIEEFVSIKENTVIGDNCSILAGTVIGGDGFEFKRENSNILRVNHYGGVVIKKNVEVQYNTAIDKAVYPWDDTIIGENTKIDNLVHIGHAVKIGSNVLLPAGSTIGGRTEIEDHVWIGIGSIVSNGLHIGRNSKCNLGSVVTKSVMENQSVTGNFAIDHNKFIENLKKMR